MSRADVFGVSTPSGGPIMRRPVKLVGAFQAVCLLLLVGCASAGPTPAPAIDGAAVARSVALCKTTLAEIEHRLGAPSRDGVLHASRIVSWVVEWEPLTRYLAVQLDAAGVVTDLYWNVPTEIPWVPVDQCRGR